MVAPSHAETFSNLYQTLVLDDEAYLRLQAYKVLLWTVKESLLRAILFSQFGSVW